MTSTAPATLTRNITKVYRSASAEQIADGIEWYGRAHRLAESLAGLHDSDTDRAAGVIAALSPQMPWDRNVRLAERLYTDGELIGGALGLSIRNATAIFEGADWREVFGKDARKIRNFAAIIANPGDDEAVCVDRHAADIAENRVSGKEAKGLNRAQYEAYADAYRRAAKILKVSPSTVQAVTWVVWRESRIRCAAAARREAGREAVQA